MNYTVIIRRNEDGLIRNYVMDGCEWENESEESSGTIWVWTEGNFGCDCNRELFFHRAAGEDDGEVECGHRKYTVLGFILPDGRCITNYDEDRLELSQQNENAATVQ